MGLVYSNCYCHPYRITRNTHFGLPLLAFTAHKLQLGAPDALKATPPINDVKTGLEWHLKTFYDSMTTFKACKDLQNDAEA